MMHINQVKGINFSEVTEIVDQLSWQTTDAISVMSVLKGQLYLQSIYRVNEIYHEKFL